MRVSRADLKENIAIANSVNHQPRLLYLRESQHHIQEEGGTQTGKVTVQRPCDRFPASNDRILRLLASSADVAHPSHALQVPVVWQTSVCPQK